jgi:histidinol-phosphate aminotransferase
LANPNNPTGTYLIKTELIELRKKLRKNILLVVDDAYAEYMKNKDYKSGLELFRNKQNVFILRTFSKIYGLASLWVGWGYGSKRIIDALNIVKPPFNVNEVAQKAAVESLRDKKFISRSIKHNFFYATKLRDFLNKYDIKSNEVSANFLLLDFTKCKVRAKYFYKKLKLKGIILRSTEEGYKIKNMLRLTIGSKKENLKFLKETKSIFKK